MSRFLFLITILTSTGVLSNAEENPLRFTLAPGTPKLAQVGVPLLHLEVPERPLSGEGLWLVPEEGPYAWTRIAPAMEPFLLQVEVDATKFEHGVLTVWNWDNEPVQQRHLTAGKPGHLEISVEEVGTYLLTLDGFRDGEYRERLIRNLAVTEDLNGVRQGWKTDEFFLGICTFPGRYHWKPGGVPTLPSGLSEDEARNLEADLMARLGFQVVRTDESLEMGRRETETGAEYLFNFERMDVAVEAYTSRGFQLGLQLMNAADWAVAEPYQGVTEHRWRYPHEEGPQRAYIRALLERYGEESRYVQVFNEPDQVEFWSGTPEEFVNQFRFSQDEIERTFPDLPIVNGGYAFVDAEKTAFFIQHLKGLVDFPAYHAHGELSGMIRNFDLMKRQNAEAGIGPKRWLNTETGFDAWRLDQERRQAQAVTQKVLYCWANDHAGVMLFCGRMTRGPGREGRDLGLVDYQFCPRFAYGAVAGLTATLAGASYRETLLESETDFLYVFVRGDDLILAGFATDDAGEVTIETDATGIEAVDAMGNAGPGSEVLTLNGYPRYWILRDAGLVKIKED